VFWLLQKVEEKIVYFKHFGYSKKVQIQAQYKLLILQFSVGYTSIDSSDIYGEKKSK
jgi:hypothetical protein